MLKFDRKSEFMTFLTFHIDSLDVISSYSYFGSVNDNWTTKIPINRYFSAHFQTVNMGLTVFMRHFNMYGLILKS